MRSTKSWGGGIVGSIVWGGGKMCLSWAGGGGVRKSTNFIGGGCHCTTV